MTDVKLKHPDSKATVNVDEDSTEVWESQGWERVGADKPASDSGKK